jgi:GcrA cell cycle regulator
VKQIVIWNTENVDKLKRLWADGLNMARIAAEIPGATRSTIAGKIYRLGIGLSPEQLAARRAQTNRHRPRAPRVCATVTFMSRRRIDLPEPDGPFFCTLFDLDAHRCRFPIGEPEDPSFRFCGYKTKSNGEPYCPFHMAVAYVPTRVTRREAA